MSDHTDDGGGRARLASMMDHLAAGLAHELNQVLTPIACGLERAEPSLDEVGLRHALHRGTLLTGGLQLVPAGDQRVGPLGLDRFVADLAPALRTLVANEIEVAGSSDRGPTLVHVDAWVLEQILWRVVQRASEQAGRPLITISTERHGGGSASGGGPATCPLLARGASCQAIRVRTSAPPTSGRGAGPLALAQALASRVGGVVAPADHWPEDGAVVIHLPIVAAQEDAHRLARVPTDVDVIVVEDDDDLRSLMRRLLQREGHVVAEAHTARDALMQLAGHRVARLLLADLSLGGGMNGEELLRRATDARPDLRVLLVSGHAVSGAPGLPFLRKPFTPRMFVAKIRELLAAPDANDHQPPPAAPGEG